MDPVVPEKHQCDHEASYSKFISYLLFPEHCQLSIYTIKQKHLIIPLQKKVDILGISNSVSG